MSRTKAPAAKEKAAKKIPRLSFHKGFYSDLEFRDMLYAVIVRCPTKSGKITSISHGDLPEGYYLFTAKDVPGSNLIETPHGSVPVFSKGNISYLGEPLGILVGPDEKTVNELYGEIQFTFDSNTIDSYLHTIEDAEQDYSQETISETKNADQDQIDAISKALALDVEDYFDTQPDDDKNIQTDKTILDSDQYDDEPEPTIITSRKIERGPCFTREKKGSPVGIDEALKKCHKVIQNSWSYMLNPPDYREPSGAICSYKNGQLFVYAPTLWLENLRDTLSEVLKIHDDDIIISKTRSNHRSSASVWYSSIIASQVAVASYHTGKCIKLVYTQEEQERFMESMRPITIVHKTGADETGKIIAMQIHIDVDAGAYNPFVQEIVDRLAIASYGCYSPQNISINASAYRSSNPPTSIDLQTLDSAAFFAVENQINELGKAYNLTPQEIRLVNLASSDKKGQHMPFLFNFDKAPDILELLAKQSDLERKYSAYRLNNIIRTKHGTNLLETSDSSLPLRGIGLACASEGSCYYGSQLFKNSDQSISVTWEKEDNVVIHCSPVSASIQEAWGKTVSEILSVSTSSVKINSDFSNDNEPLLPETIYSNISAMTELLQKCCETLKRQHQKSKLPLEVKKTSTASQQKLWNQNKFEGIPFHTTSFGAATVEIDLDQNTFRENIRNIYIIVNGGRIMNLQDAENTLKLSVQKILSSLVDFEQIDYSNIHISFVNSNGDSAQIGELLYQIIPAAYTQAVSQALGITIDCLPLQTDSLYKMLLAKHRKIEAMKMQKAQEKNNSEQEDAK
ncbi:MAG: xanthine dehydrogenase family protein [Treponema sp.]|nr:xanthine dehydrogenase family protein [Treponema sp.]